MSFSNFSSDQIKLFPSKHILQYLKWMLKVLNSPIPKCIPYRLGDSKLPSTHSVDSWNSVVNKSEQSFTGLERIIYNASKKTVAKAQFASQLKVCHGLSCL